MGIDIQEFINNQAQNAPNQEKRHQDTRKWNSANVQNLQHTGNNPISMQSTSGIDANVHNHICIPAAKIQALREESKNGKKKDEGKRRGKPNIIPGKEVIQKITHIYFLPTHFQVIVVKPRNFIEIALSIMF
jgi:hypothetical protein